MAREAKNFVNLDALLPRADLFEHPDGVMADAPSIRITDLEPCVTYNLLRKPDFQRETASWNPEQVAGLVQTFCASDIIPAVILWQNGNQIFVVDGAHRLSALVAWVRNDYGAGELSQDQFRGRIPEQQRLMHEKTANLINHTVGTWEDYRNKHGVLGLKVLAVQWITGHSAPQAAKAFVRINQGGTIIDGLEGRILQAARSALSVATRVIARGGMGHPYWRHFKNSEAKAKAPELGAEIFKLLFEPPLETPIKTLDVPLAGLGYGAGVLRFAFDLVALANDLPVPDSTRRRPPPAEPLPNDLDGADTLTYLRRVRGVVRLILSNEARSLGLHPALYFYTASGAFQPAALLNTVAWVMDLERRTKLDQFRRVRGLFEDLILAHPTIVKPAAHKLGSGARTRTKMLEVFNRAVELLTGDPSLDAAWAGLSKEFPYLVRDEQDEAEAAGLGLPFSSSAKSAVSLADLSAAPRCPLCGGLLHRNGKVMDHRDKRAAGGSSHSSNGRWVHPICNSNREKDEAAAKMAAAT